MSHAKYVWHEDDETEETPVAGASGPVISPASVANEQVTDTASDDRPAIIRLAHAWLNERGSPEMQPWPAEIVETVIDQLQQQQSILDSLISDISTSDEEQFRLNLVQLDAERSKWLLRSFLRTRLEKVCLRASSSRLTESSWRNLPHISRLVTWNKHIYQTSSLGM
mgnify:FL=1